ncbi:electron carrier/ protein disulfide oxidoreductase [Anaeramoeba flamelloides]|uniref:Electron carrier/ protein disulfide oxidoreductase n=1 Tax=Anaeramoeba flamelloides TaxID=1746091 RepID=A0AAV7ZLM5_9EUKA|nr:electron carrier/ protein disulfide oxidoreductase [Anaeramoeba flamelloides]
MGNEINPENSQQQKLRKKAFKKFTKKRLNSNDPILFLDQFHRVIQFNSNVPQILNRKKEDIFGEQIENFSPKNQIHVGTSSTFNINNQIIKLLDAKQETVKIIWSFLDGQKQENLKKGNEQTQEKEKTNKEQEPQLPNENLIWVSVHLKKLFVENSIIIEAKMEKIDKPIELLKKRRSIQNLKKQIANVQRKLQEHNSVVEKSTIPEKTQVVFEKISKQVSITNVIREKFQPVKNATDKIKEQLKEYEPNSKEHRQQQTEREEIVSEQIKLLRIQEKKLSFQEEKITKKKSEYNSLRQIKRNKLKLTKLQKENKSIKREFKEKNDLFSKQKEHLLSVVKKKELVIMNQSEYQQQKKEIQELMDTIDYTNRQIKTLNQRMKTTNKDHKIEEEIFGFKTNIKKFTNLNNRTKAQISQIKGRNRNNNRNGNKNKNKNNNKNYNIKGNKKTFKNNDRLHVGHRRNLTISPSSESIKTLQATSSDILKQSKSIFSSSMNDISVLNKKQANKPKRNSIVFKSKKIINQKRQRTKSMNFQLKNKLFVNLQKEKSFDDSKKNILFQEKSNKNNTPLESINLSASKIRSHSTDTRQTYIDKIKNHTQFKTFDELFKFPIGIEYFREYLSDRFKQEPLLFYLAYQKFIEYYDEESGEEMSDYILEKFFIQGGLFHFELPEEISKELIKNWKISKFSSEMFDKAKEYLLETFLKKDFEFFKESVLFQELLDLEYKENSQYNYSTYKSGTFISETKNNKILNSSFTFKGTARSPIKIVEKLMENLIDTLDAHYSRRMNMIRCDSLESSILFKKFIVASGELQKVNLKDIQELPIELKKVFFINLYNIICIHSLVANQFPNSPNSLLQFLSTSIYQLGTSYISLSDIKYHILQLATTNKKIAKLPITIEKLHPIDISQVDPRIHFALLSLSSETCILQAYNSQNIDQQLDFASQEFLKKYLTVDIEKKIINLPVIIEEGYKDFGYNQLSVLIFFRNFWEFDNPLSLYSYQFKSSKSKIEIYIEFY